MKTVSLNPPPSPLAIWTGRGLSTLTTAFLLADAGAHLLAPELVRAPMEGSGFTIEHAAPIGCITLACAILYALPRTAVLGAILITGFLGGAICAHFRLGEVGSPPQIITLIVGLMAWGGLYLRDPRLRALLPVITAGNESAHPKPLSETVSAKTA